MYREFFLISVCYVRNKSNLTGSLYCLGKLTLMHSADACCAARKYFRTLGQVML